MNKLLKLAISFQENLGDYLKNNPTEYGRMGLIEQESFSKYNDPSFVQDPDDIEDDFNQPGATGVGVVNNNQLSGYVYGYDMTDDEIEDLEIDENITNKELEEQFGAKFYAPVPEYFFKQLSGLVNNKKIFYIANIALPEYKITLPKLLHKLLTQLRDRKYEYVSFDALSDSARLFMNGMVPKNRILSLFGVKLIVTIPTDDSNQHIQTLIKI